MECVVSEIMHVQYTFRINIIKCSQAKTNPPLVSFTDSNLIQIMKDAFEQCVCVLTNQKGTTYRQRYQVVWANIIKESN
jgi:hypothetical protein